MFFMTRWEVRAYLILFRFWRSQWLGWTLIMYSFHLHEILLGLIQFKIIYNPRISKCYRSYLFVKSFRKIFLNVCQTASTGRMRNDFDVFKPWFLDIILPNGACVVRHILIKRNLITIFVMAFVGVHYQNAILLFVIYCPIDLRQHRPHFEISVNRCRSRPYTWSDWSTSLYQNKCWSFWIFLNLLFTGVVKFRTHINIAFCFQILLVSEKFILGHLNFLEVINAFHLVLAVIDYVFCDQFILIHVTFAIKECLGVSCLSNSPVFEIIHLVFRVIKFFESIQHH